MGVVLDFEKCLLVEDVKLVVGDQSRLGFDVEGVLVDFLVENISLNTEGFRLGADGCWHDLSEIIFQKRELVDVQPHHRAVREPHCRIVHLKPERK